mmetsp:Transcript_74833/g.207195  ORF Transcript_74833/g.207195 Transcript_74833/m.207195 type:complete len:213 (+) Transcript_74833:212-850(+)
MMHNTRSRTVFTLKHKYSAEDVEDCPELPAPVVKKKSVAESASEARPRSAPGAGGLGGEAAWQDDDGAEAAAAAGRALLVGALSGEAGAGDVAAFDAERTLRPKSAPADVYGIPSLVCDGCDDLPPATSPPSRLAGTMHLAGTFTRSSFRKDLMRTQPIALDVDATDAGELAVAPPAGMPSSPGELCYCSSFVPVTGPRTPAAAAGSVESAA